MTPEGGTASEDSFRLRLQGGPEAASTARRALAKLRPDLEPPTMETLRLLVTELVANSVRHAGASSVDLRAIVTSDLVWLEVADAGSGFDVATEQRLAADREDSGWGLLLVERLADAWGVGSECGVTRVWFELKRQA